MAIGGMHRVSEELPAGFLLHDPPANTEPERLLNLRPSDFALVNPKTGTAPIFLTQSDADIVLKIYRNHPVFDAEIQNFEQGTAVIRHVRQSDMTNDSGHFWIREQLEADGWYPVELNRWKKGDEEMLPLFQGRTIHHFDHRYNSVGFNPDNLHNPYINDPVTVGQHRNPRFYSRPRYWVRDDFVRQKLPEQPGYAIGFRLITRTTDERTMIATITPWAGYGNSLPILIPKVKGTDDELISKNIIDAFTDCCPLWAANFSSFAMDFVAKRKLQGTNMNWFVLEQLPVITRLDYERCFGDTTAADLVRNHVLRLSYTAYDLQPFAQAQGYDGEPYGWDIEVRRHLRARLDALYFILYGLNQDDAAYVMDSFPITRRNEEQAFGGMYLTKELILRYMSALQAGDTETVVVFPSP